MTRRWFVATPFALALMLLVPTWALAADLVVTAPQEGAVIEGTSVTVTFETPGTRSLRRALCLPTRMHRLRSTIPVVLPGGMVLRNSRRQPPIRAVESLARRITTPRAISSYASPYAAAPTQRSLSRSEGIVIY